MPGRARIFARDVPGIHVVLSAEDVDGRDEPGHDSSRV